MSPSSPELYKTHVWKDYVSNTFMANETHFPDTTQKPITTLDRRFVRYKEHVGHLPKQPWGRHRSYAGLGHMAVPEHLRPKAEAPVFVAKGHKHFGSGIFPFPSFLDRGVTSIDANESARRRGYPESPIKRSAEIPAASKRYTPANPIVHTNKSVDGRFSQENLNYPGRMNPPSTIEKTVTSARTMDDIMAKYRQTTIAGYQKSNKPTNID
ncbi:uncharacterized protein LOC134851757 [Symsagittifera roscoffensis]|uniref:uncharacterized protein LOC134851757 n=1 Tax=Symsagittifera roscoffensis TaxID=84072 RepID=UPI00307CB66D